MSTQRISQGNGRHSASCNGNPTKPNSNGFVSIPMPRPSVDSTDGKPPALGVVRGVDPKHQGEKKAAKFIWKVEKGATLNYRLLGQRLAATCGLYRNGTSGHGLIQVLPDRSFRLITKGVQLAPLIVDRVPMQVEKQTKVVSELPAANHLNTMLQSEKFLGNFLAVDELTTLPMYLPDFSLASPGYNPGNRILYLGEEPLVVRSLDTINAFLNAMDFATTADRTNTVAAALTVLLRGLWQGEKPVVLVTATQSHSGKGTITDFFRGAVPKADLLYEDRDWPMQQQFQRQIQRNPDIGIVVFDNARLDSAGGRAKFIRSAFVEGFITNAEVTLASPGAGEPIRLKNKYVLTFNTNDGALSPDLMNRALSIHLSPKDDILDRKSEIGNPKLEFLPQNRDRIEAELRGMIENWKEAGCPLDESVRHPMTPWARTIGGILKVNGLTDFLANYGTRKSADDPIREALGILGAARPGKKLRPMEWAELAVELGLAKTLFSTNERDTPKGRERAVGVLFQRYPNAVLHAQSETTRYRLQLEGKFLRWTPGKPPHKRYVFTVLAEEAIPVDGEGGA